MLTVDLCRFRENLRADRIVPYFQPIVGLKSGKLVGFEILARWQHPDEGLLLPDRFIPAIEKAGVISELTDRLLALAAQSAAAWQAKPVLSLNISPVELRDRSLPQRLKQAAEAGGLPLDRLTLEITENALIDDFALARSIIDEAKGLGMRIALDDLGTGYASLHYLQALPIDEVKIAACFVRQLNQQRESRQIVSAMIGLGRELGLATVAEGVEEEAQAEVLVSLGCGCGQGWLFGRPVAAEKVPDVIARFSAPLSAVHDSTATAAPRLTQFHENRPDWRAANEGSTPRVRAQIEADCARIGVDVKLRSPKEIVIAANQYHAAVIENPGRRKSIRSLLKLRKSENSLTVQNPSDNKRFRRAPLVLMKAIESCAISGEADREQFVSYVRDAYEQFACGNSADDALNTAHEIQIGLKRHFWQASRFFTAHKQEYHKMVSMFMETVASLSVSGQGTMSHFKEIEKSLHSATLIEDIRKSRHLLGKCLSTIREELRREQPISAGVHNMMQSGIEAGAFPYPQSAAECDQASQDFANDPVTGLPSHKKAESALVEALNSGHTYFVVPIVAKGVDVIYFHFGSKVGDSVLCHFAEKLRSYISDGDRLFHWHGASFVVLVAKPTFTEAKRKYSVLSNMRLKEAIKVGTRSAWVQVASSWKVIAVTRPHSSLVMDINQCVLAEQPSAGLTRRGHCQYPGKEDLVSLEDSADSPGWLSA